MTTTDELWLDAKVTTQVEAWCRELGWECVQASWHLRIRPEWTETRLLVEALRVDGADCVRLVYPVCWTVSRNPPVPRELLEYLMRRNDQLAWTHWCLTRHSGPAVAIVCKIAELTAAEFRRAAERLRDERAELLKLAEKEVVEPKRAVPCPAS